MTGEKAIKILNGWDGVFIGYSSDEVNEAIKMATEALKHKRMKTEKQVVDVLGKIEKEITDLPTEFVAEMRFRNKILKIISKHKKGEHLDNKEEEK